MADLEVCPIEQLPPGTIRIVQQGQLDIGVYNCGGELYALEDRCSHDDGPLCEGDWDEDTCRVVCPRHGSAFDLRTGRALANGKMRLRLYPTEVENGTVFVRLPRRYSV